MEVKIDEKKSITVLDALRGALTNKDVISRVAVDMKIDLPEGKEEISMITFLMLHCMINGPVGVAKSTTFPFGSSGSIQSLSKINKLTNRKWRGLCYKMAESVRDEFPITGIECPAKYLIQDYWPLKDWPRRLK